MRGGEHISVSHGRINIKLILAPDSKGRRRLAELNSLPLNTNLRDSISTLGIWEVRIKADRRESPITAGGYGGYVAIDQIVRDSDVASQVHSFKGSMDIISSTRRLIRESGVSIRPNWKDILPESRSKAELAMEVIGSMERTRLTGTTSLILPRSRELSVEVLKGACGRLKFSRWSASINDENECWLLAQETCKGIGSVHSERDWTEILRDRMLVTDPAGTYSRKVGHLSCLKIRSTACVV
jgi:hypothetical protein